MSPRFCAITCAAALAVGTVWPAPAHAQEPVPEPGVASRPWRFLPGVQVETGFDSNVFLLDPGKKNDLSSPSDADRASGRFAGMESASDLITTLKLEGSFKGKGLLDRSLTLEPEFAYDLYSSNGERSNFRLGMAVSQALPRGGQLRLEAHSRPDYFSKCYLADAVDLDASGTIAPAERIYRPGRYGEMDASLECRTRLAKRTDDRPAGVRLALGGGWYRREYEAPFAGRDLEGPMASSGLDFDFAHDVSFTVGYQVAALSAPVTSEVMLLDEPAFDQDFNGNGNPDDLDVRTVQAVDRSRTEHAVAAELEFDLQNGAHVSLTFEHRLRNYSSQQPYDVADRDRHDARNAFGLDLGFRVAHDLRLNVGGGYASQTTNRGGDPGAAGDEDDYSRMRASLRLDYQR